MMKRCELCKSKAKVYCDSDSASLCWSCDAKVHSANFLVARHSRSLLCQICQSSTPWSASGEKLCPSTAAICRRCVVKDISDDDDDEFVGGEYGDELESEVSVDEIVNQVAPPPPATSSSSSEEFSNSDGGGSLKRKRRNVADLISEDDLDCSSANTNHLTPESATGDETSFRSSCETTARKLKRFRQLNIISGDYLSVKVPGTRKSTRTIELDLNSSP